MVLFRRRNIIDTNLKQENYMKKNVFSIFLITAAAIFLSSCSDEWLLSYAEIESAEWADDSYKKIYVYYDAHPECTDLQVEVYRDGKEYDKNYYIYGHEYNSFSHNKRETITLNKRCPVNACVKIWPANSNSKIQGSCELWREQGQ